MNHRLTRPNLRSQISVALLAASALGSASAFAQQEASVQASTRKTGLDIVAPVMVGGSDTAAQFFQNQVLPNMNQFLAGSLGERQNINDSAFALDPAKLNLQTDADVRVYFVGEGAGYANSLGFNTAGASVTTGDPLLIFPNASSALSSYDPVRDANKYTGAQLEQFRTRTTPLLPGDFVDLGSFASGTQLDFFLIADGANGGSSTYSTDQSANPDKINHVVAFAYAMADSPYLIIGFEDLYGGGDKDFNDLIFAIDIGAANVAALTATPEPATYLTLGAFLGLGLLWKRRQDGHSDEARELAAGTTFVAA